MTAVLPKPFVRVRFTWLAYLMLGYYSYLNSTLGPLLPFLRSELDLSYSLAGLHVSAFALGLILSGLGGERLSKRWGRTRVFWGGGAGLALGALGLSLGDQLNLTLASTFMMGLLGSLTLMMIQAALADHHGEQRTIALTEANVVASLFSMLAPLLVGGFQAIGLGWRAALLVAVGLYTLLFGWFRQEAIPGQSISFVKLTSASKTLPLAFWAYWVVVFLGVAVEWCLIAWTSEFLEDKGLARATAAILVSFFFLAMLLGRLAGSYLARTISATALLLIALGITLIGFPLFWLAPSILLSVAGLFITGLGVANLFPLTLSVAVSVVPQQAEVASARVLLGVGLAIFSVPLGLGWLADRVGLQEAFGAVGLILIITFITTYFTNRAVVTARNVIA